MRGPGGQGEGAQWCGGGAWRAARTRQGALRRRTVSRSRSARESLESQRQATRTAMWIDGCIVCSGTVTSCNEPACVQRRAQWRSVQAWPRAQSGGGDGDNTRRTCTAQPLADKDTRKKARYAAHV